MFEQDEGVSDRHCEKVSVGVLMLLGCCGNFMLRSVHIIVLVGIMVEFNFSPLK